MTCHRCGIRLPERLTIGDPCPSCGYVREPHDDASVAFAPGALLHGRFRIEEILGEGGFGVTYRATDTTLNSQVAVKELITPGSRRSETGHLYSRTNAPAGESVQRFLREAKALRMIDNDAVVRVRDFFEANNTAYLVMELLEGETLKQALLRDVVWSETATAELAERMAQALQAVHTLGFLHRDIKPANIMIVPNRGPVLIDFGAVRVEATEGNQNNTQVVTHGYAPLEQYGSRGALGPYTDLYSLGAVLFETLVGDRAPSSTDRVNHDDLRPVSDLVPNLRTGLPFAIDAALKLRQGDRPQTVTEFVTRLRTSPKRVETPPAADTRDGSTLTAASTNSEPTSLTPATKALPNELATTSSKRLAEVNARAAVAEHLGSEPNRGKKRIALVAAGIALAVGGGVVLATRGGDKQSTQATAIVASTAPPTSAPVQKPPTTVALDVPTTSTAPTVPATTIAPILFDRANAKIGLIYDSTKPLPLEFAQAAKAAQAPGTPLLDECDTSKAPLSACVDRWVQDRALVGILGPTSSADAETLTALYDARIPVVLAGATRQSLTKPRRSPATFRLTPSDYQIGLDAAKVALAHGGHRAFVYVPDELTLENKTKADAVSSGFTTGFTGTSAGTGGTLPPLDGSVAFDVVLTNVANGPQVEGIVNQLKAARWSGVVLSTSEVFSGAFTGAGCTPGRIQCLEVGLGNRAKAGYEIARSKAGFPPAQLGSWSVSGFDGFTLLAQRFAETKPGLTLAEVRETLATSISASPFNGLGSQVAFDEFGDNTTHSYAVYERTRAGWKLRS